MSAQPVRGCVPAILFIMVALSGCGSGRAQPPAQSLPPYTPEAARLFDDAFAPPLFGFDTEARDLAQDLELRERIRQASFVMPARIETVSRVGGTEHSGAYEIILVPLAPPLVGTYPGGPMRVTIPTSNSSYAWVEGAGAAWVGTRVLAFGRLYAGGTGAPGEKPSLHFRCEADTVQLRSIVERDAALRLVR